MLKSNSLKQLKHKNRNLLSINFLCLRQSLEQFRMYELKRAFKEEELMLKIFAISFGVCRAVSNALLIALVIMFSK